MIKNGNFKKAIGPRRERKKNREKHNGKKRLNRMTDYEEGASTRGQGGRRRRNRGKGKGKRDGEGKGGSK